MTEPWWKKADLLATQRADLAKRGVIVPRTIGVGFDWNDAVDATTRAILALATREQWTIRAVIAGRAYLVSANGERECHLVMEFDPAPRVTHVRTHDGRDLAAADALAYLGGA